MDIETEQEWEWQVSGGRSSSWMERQELNRWWVRLLLFSAHRYVQFGARNSDPIHARARIRFFFVPPKKMDVCQINVANEYSKAITTNEYIEQKRIKLNWIAMKTHTHTHTDPIQEWMVFSFCFHVKIMFELYLLLYYKVNISRYFLNIFENTHTHTSIYWGMNGEKHEMERKKDR